MNQIRNSILVQFDIHRIRKILNDSKAHEHSAVLDNVANKIEILIGSNSSGVCTSLNEAYEFKREFKNDINNKPLNNLGKHDKKESKTLCTNHHSNCNKDIPVAELKICIKKTKRKKKLHGIRKSKLKGSTHLSLCNMGTLKDIKNMIPLPEIKIYTGKGKTNESIKMPCIRFKGFIDISFSDDDKDGDDDDDDDKDGDNNNQIESLISTTDKTTSKVILVYKYPSYLKKKNALQQGLVTKKLEIPLESTKLNNMNTTSLDESNMSKKSIQTNLSEKNLNGASPDTIDLTLDSDLESESESNNSKIQYNNNFDYTKNTKYQMLQTIVYKNYRIYHKKNIQIISSELRKNKLLWKSKEAWDTLKAETVKIILEDILKLICHIEDKNIVFMGCLSVIFRSTVSHYQLSETALYNHFVLFADLIEKCLMNINDCFWKTMFPNGWNIFFNGCLIVDFILYGKSISMYKYVNWNEMPNILRCHNHSNDQTFSDKLNSFNNQFEKPLADVLLMPSTSHITTVPQVKDEEPTLRKRPIDISSMPSASNITVTSPQAYIEKPIKRQKVY